MATWGKVGICLSATNPFLIPVFERQDGRLADNVSSKSNQQEEHLF